MKNQKRKRTASRDPTKFKIGRKKREDNLSDFIKKNR